MKRPSRPVRLGIGGLPSELRSLRLGCAYAVVVDDADLRLQLVAGTLVEALSAKQATALIGNLPIAPLLDFLARCDIDGHRAAKQKRLHLFRPDRDSVARLARAGTAQLLDEFDHFGFEPGGIIILAPGEALMHDAAEGDANRHVALLREWLRETATTLLALLERPSETLLTTGGFDGVAAIGNADSRLRWSTHYWRLPEGQIISPEYPLRRLPEGGLGVDTRVSARDQPLDTRLAEAVDEERVIATASVVRGEQRIPTLWEIVEDLDALSARASDAVGATCVLETDAPHRFRDLAYTVHSLRRQRGPALKIVVCQVGAPLRRSQEQLLLSLGANVVVLATDTDRLGAIIGSLRGQRYNREVIADFGEAFMHGLPQAQGGYLAPEAFCIALIEGARRAATLGLESVLVRLVLRAGAEPLQTLKGLRITRPGDICTFGDGSVYLFMFGCWDRDADQIVDRLFAVPIGELIESQVRYPTNTSAMIEANVLHQRLQLHPAQVFSLQLESHACAPTTVERAPPIAVTTSVVVTPAPALRNVTSSPLRLTIAP